MANFNRVILIGNLTKDPDFKQQPSGQGLCKLSLASNRQFRNKQTGAMVQEVCYIDVTVWGPQAENCRQYLQKGRPVLVEGRLKLDSWKDADGQQKQRHTIVADSVVFLGARGEAESRSKDEMSEDGVHEALFKDEAPFADDLPF
ncbi:single-stranded DNA-binding protein [Candidatus Dependentiae bacterium]|nr:single-stranded DNA-binding protein [Candidatus Dependentiae bacterium]